MESMHAANSNSASYMNGDVKHTRKDHVSSETDTISMLMMKKHKQDQLHAHMQEKSARLWWGFALKFRLLELTGRPEDLEISSQGSKIPRGAGNLDYNISAAVILE